MFHKFREKIKKHNEVLDCLVDCTDDRSVQEYLIEREKLNTLLVQEESYRKQRAKLFWLNEGDKNTKFFHSSSTARRKMNHINYLTKENGECVHDHDSMCAIVRDYFTG